MLTIATTPEQAIQAEGELRAGGTDVQERRRSGIASGPVVDIRRLPGYDAIAWNDDGAASIGALVTIDAVATDAQIRRHYAGLAQAAAGLATPQIRWMSTMGGALLQRTRCAYYRHPAFTCFKSGGEGCPARTGHNPNGVVFDLGPCVYPHPATLGMALLAYEAQVDVYERGTRPITALYGDGSDPTRDHLLDADELLTHIRLPPPVAGEQAAYFRSISRAEAEWPIVEALVRFVVEDGTITMARVGVGGVATIPLRLSSVEAALEQQPATPETLENAAAAAADGVNPLPQTRHKVTFLTNTVLETLERALQS